MASSSSNNSTNKKNELSIPIIDESMNKSETYSEITYHTKNDKYGELYVPVSDAIDIDSLIVMNKTVPLISTSFMYRTTSIHHTLNGKLISYNENNPLDSGEITILDKVKQVVVKKQDTGIVSVYKWPSDNFRIVFDEQNHNFQKNDFIQINPIPKNPEIFTVKYSLKFTLYAKPYYTLVVDNKQNIAIFTMNITVKNRSRHVDFQGFDTIAFFKKPEESKPKIRKKSYQSYSATSRDPSYQKSIVLDDSNDTGNDDNSDDDKFKNGVNIKLRTNGVEKYNVMHHSKKNLRVISFKIDKFEKQFWFFSLDQCNPNVRFPISKDYLDSNRDILFPARARYGKSNGKLFNHHINKIKNYNYNDDYLLQFDRVTNIKSKLVLKNTEITSKLGDKTEKYTISLKSEFQKSISFIYYMLDLRQPGFRISGIEFEIQENNILNTNKSISGNDMISLSKTKILDYIPYVHEKNLLTKGLKYIKLQIAPKQKIIFNLRVKYNKANNYVHFAH